MTTLCSICRSPLPVEIEASTVADHKAFDIEGYLKYIELAHIECAKTANVSRPGYWSVL